MTAVPTVHLNGIDVYYERHGSGPRLLFLNGSGATLASSGPLIAVYGQQFDVVAHDQRGLGRTSIPDGPYTMAQYAADAAALASHLGWDRYRVVGVSFGGMVAQELAVTFPERVERLALLCTSPGGAGGSSYPLHRLGTLSPEERQQVGLTILDSRFSPSWLAEHDSDRLLAQGMEQAGQRATTDEARRGERLQLEARRDHDVFDRLGRITCPTLVASGRFDGIAPWSNGDAIAQRVANAELRVYDGGHAFFAQDRRAMPEVLEFLAGL